MLRTLSIADAPVLQGLFEDCADYFVLAEGAAPPPSAARDEFAEMPAGARPGDKFIHAWWPAGAPEPLAALEGLRDYPGPGLWYIGLLLVRPPLRSGGLGARVVRQFEDLARGAGAVELRLCVFDASPGALRFWTRNGYEHHRAIPAQVFGARVHARTELRKPLGATPSMSRTPGGARPADTMRERRQESP